AGTIVFATTKSGYEGWMQYGDGAKPDQLDGAYEAEEVVVNGKAPSIDWRRVGISTRGRFVIRLMNDSVLRYRMEQDPRKRTIAVWPDTLTSRSTLAYEWADPSHLRLKGVLVGDTVNVRLRKMETKEFALLGRGFHWVSEYPYNK